MAKTRPGTPARPTRLVAWMYSAVVSGWPVDDHQRKAWDIEADGHHVRRQHRVETVCVLPGVRQPQECLGVLLRSAPARELSEARMPEPALGAVGLDGPGVRSAVGPRAALFLELAREPLPEVAYTRHEGIVAVADPLEATVVDHLGPPCIEQLVPIRISVEYRLRTGEQGGGKRREAVLLIEHGGEVADVEPPRTVPVGPREVRVVVRQPGRREHREVPRVQPAHLLRRHADGRSGRDVLGTNASPDEQGIEARLVQPGDRAKRSGDEMQLVLDDQFRRARAGANSKEGPGSFFPRDARELVDGADQQRGRAPVQGFVHHVAGQRAILRTEFARLIDAVEAKIVFLCLVAAGGVELRATPRTSFQEQLVPRIGAAAPDLLHELAGLVECVRADLAADQIPISMGASPTARDLACGSAPVRTSCAPRVRTAGGSAGVACSA